MTTGYRTGIGQLPDDPYISRVFHVERLLPMQQNRILNCLSTSAT